MTEVVLIRRLPSLYAVGSYPGLAPSPQPKTCVVQSFPGLLWAKQGSIGRIPSSLKQCRAEVKGQRYGRLDERRVRGALLST